MTELIHGYITPAPHGLILCRDTRLCRLLQAELAYLGVAARSCDALPATVEGMGILLLDGDGFDPSDGMALAAAANCPLLLFGRKPAFEQKTVFEQKAAFETKAVGLPRSAADGTPSFLYLRRPFLLTALEDAVRKLLAGLPSASPLIGAVPTAPAADTPNDVPADTDLADGDLADGHLVDMGEEKTLRFSVRDGTVTVGGRTVPLTPAEQVILDYLLAHRGETVPRDALASLLKGGGNSVDVYVCHLRTKIEKPLGRRLITTIRGVGYRLEG